MLEEEGSRLGLSRRSGTLTPTAESSELGGSFNSKGKERYRLTDCKLQTPMVSRTHIVVIDFLF